MAPSSFILMALLSLALVSGITEARMVPIGLHKNLQGVDKDVTVAEAIENLMHAESTSSFSAENTRDCHTSSNNQNKGNELVRDFKPRPSITTYPDDDAKLKGHQTTFKKNFDPRPNVSAYPDDDDTKLKGYQKTFKKDFDPRPNVSAYPDDDDTKLKDYQTTSKKDFESRPTRSAYSDKNAFIEKKFVKDFEPRPNLLIYQD